MRQCIPIQDPSHVTYSVARWKIQQNTLYLVAMHGRSNKAELVHQVGSTCVDNLVGKMLQSPGNWKKVDLLINIIMKKKRRKRTNTPVHQGCPTLQVDVTPTKGGLAVALIFPMPLG